MSARDSSSGDRSEATTDGVADIAVVGLGYVGITLAVTLADCGFRVLGIEKRREVVDLLRSGRSPVFEPGIENLLQEWIGLRLRVVADWPEKLPKVCVICVSTPVQDATQQPDLRNLAEVSDSIADRIDPDGVVIVRSTVPVGTSRAVVGSALWRRSAKVGLAFCPERTVQGAAIQELRRLPQVIGAHDERSRREATRVFSRLAVEVVQVPDCDTAEMIKLVNNSHTDVLYSFGNEVALLAQQHGLDPAEVVRGANEGYTMVSADLAVLRPRIAKPGFVGGGCLSKDPYLLLCGYHSGEERDRSLFARARKLAEGLPERCANDFLLGMAEEGIREEQATVLVCGFAYKGYPETDDLRGTPATRALAVLTGRVANVLGQDFRVSREALSAFAVEVVELEEAIPRVDGILILNDHAGYRDAFSKETVSRLRRPSVVYDSWRVLNREAWPETAAPRYMSIGYGG
ncbi:nucleotide sugar dehydrogenase [Planctomycetota bacterium]